MENKTSSSYDYMLTQRAGHAIRKKRKQPLKFNTKPGARIVQYAVRFHQVINGLFACNIVALMQKIVTILWDARRLIVTSLSLSLSSVSIH